MVTNTKSTEAQIVNENENIREELLEVLDNEIEDALGQHKKDI